MPKTLLNSRSDIGFDRSFFKNLGSCDYIGVIGKKILQNFQNSFQSFKQNFQKYFPKLLLFQLFLDANQICGV